MSCSSSQRQQLCILEVATRVNPGLQVGKHKLVCLFLVELAIGSTMGRGLNSSTCVIKSTPVEKSTDLKSTHYRGKNVLL